MENLLLYDALSFTSKIHSPQDIIELLGLTACTWETVKGAHGYRERLYFSCISIHFNGTDDMGIWIEMTGQGCRAFEEYGNGDYESIFQMILYHDKEMNLTRLDVAFDDHTGILDIDQLCNDTRYGFFVSRFSDWQVIEGSKGSSITHGSMKSDVFLRIYDKAAERHLDDGSHWIRVELQLRRERAVAFASISGDIGDRFCGVLLNYVRYVDEDELDSNKWRWSLKSYWADLVGTASRISLYVKPGTEYNIDHIENYVFRQAGNAIDTYIQIKGEDAFLDKLKKRGTHPNPKYEALKAQYGLKSDRGV